MSLFCKLALTDKGTITLRPLAGQRFPDGSNIPMASRVFAPKDYSMSKYQIGTIFGCSEFRGNLTSLSLINIESILYPVAGGEYPILNVEHELILKEYQKFIGTSEEETYVPTIKHAEGLLGKMMRNERFNVPNVEDGYFVEPSNWYLLLRNINNCINTLLVGNSGCGKTSTLTLACQKLDLPYTIYDMGAMHDPIPSLLGVHRLEEGGSVFDYARFTEDVQRPGVIILDELSRCSPMAVNILFPCLDHRRELPVELAGSRDTLRNIKVHPECCFVATANVGTEYSGTMSMDRALVGRFFPLELSFMPKEMEEKVLVKRCGIDANPAEVLIRIASQIRRQHTVEELSTTISTRETLMAGSLVADGWTALQAMELVYLPLFEGTKENGERSIVAKMIMGM